MRRCLQGRTVGETGPPTHARCPAWIPPAPYQPKLTRGLAPPSPFSSIPQGRCATTAPGDLGPAYIVAREALEAMLDATDDFVARRPDFPIKIGVYSFSSSASTVSADPAARSRHACERRWHSCRGLEAARRSGKPCVRRGRSCIVQACSAATLLVVTDGENTAGRRPDDVAREIFSKSEGAVQISLWPSTRAPRNLRFSRKWEAT